MKLAVQQADPSVVRSVRLIVDKPETAAHPIFNVSRSLGTGKATCRSCNKLIKENERTILFHYAPHEPDHEHSYRRVRMVIHEDDCSGSGRTIRCPLPACGDQISETQFSKHWQNHGIGSGWQLNRAASFNICAKHNIAHCGQCEEDRELEKPKLDERVEKIYKTFEVKACVPCWTAIADVAGPALMGLQEGANTGVTEHDEGSAIHKIVTDVTNPVGFAVQRAKQMIKKVKSSEEWRHSEEDGFEMWETTEDPNQFAIIENNDKYDLYVLKGSFSSSEEAKSAAESIKKTAQDGGGGSSSSGGGGGDGGSASSGSTSGGDAGGGGISNSGESADSSDNESSESDIQNSRDNDEDPRPPSTSKKDCPQCKIPLQSIDLINGIQGFVCGSCGYTYRKKQKDKRLTSWIDNLSDINSLTSKEDGEIKELDIEPQLPPSLLPSPELQSEIKPASDLFIATKTALRTTVCQRCKRTYKVNKKGHFTGFCETCKEQLGMVTHRWDSQDARRHHDG